MTQYSVFLRHKYYYNASIDMRFVWDVSNLLFQLDKESCEAEQSSHIITTLTILQISDTFSKHGHTLNHIRQHNSHEK